jgi:hypothetical protein
MTVRSRLINFRVTDEEFHRLKTASARHNARCLSDFARTAILERAPSVDAVPESRDAVSDCLQAFDRRLTRLESNISRLFDALADARGTGSPNGPSRQRL